MPTGHATSRRGFVFLDCVTFQSRCKSRARVAGVQLFGKFNAPAAIWLGESVANRLRAASGSGESYSDVILRLFEMETR